MKRLLLVLGLLTPTFTFGASNISGYWAVKCGGFGGNIQIDTEGDVRVNVNDNNLFVSSRLKSDENGKTTLYYQDVIETENDVIDWRSISKSKPIASMSLKDGVLNVFWRGFYDVNEKKYVWINEPDFVVAAGGNNNIKMNKCNFR